MLQEGATAGLGQVLVGGENNPWSDCAANLIRSAYARKACMTGRSLRIRPMELTGPQYSLTKKQSGTGGVSGEGSQVELQIDIVWEI